MVSEIDDKYLSLSPNITHPHLLFASGTVFDVLTNIIGSNSQDGGVGRGAY